MGMYLSRRLPAPPAYLSRDLNIRSPFSKEGADMNIHISDKQIRYKVSDMGGKYATLNCIAMCMDIVAR